MATVKYLDRCRAECTRDVIFLLRYRNSKKQIQWFVDSVWLSREEAEDFAKRHEYRWAVWEVYGTCANGELVELIKGT